MTLFTGETRRPPGRRDRRGRRDDDLVRARDVHRRGARHPRTPLHEPRRAGVRARRTCPEVVKGALFARYSRTKKSLRRLFLDEFAEDVAPTASSTRPARRARRSSTSGCSWSTATTRWRSWAACTWRASRRRSCCARRSSGDGWPRTWSSPRATCATTTGPADAGARRCRPRSPARRSEPRFRAYLDTAFGAYGADVRADGDVLPGAVPARTRATPTSSTARRSWRRRATRCAVLLPAGDPVEPGHLRAPVSRTSSS